MMIYSFVKQKRLMELSGRIREFEETFLEVHGIAVGALHPYEHKPKSNLYTREALENGLARAKATRDEIRRSLDRDVEAITEALNFFDSVERIKEAQDLSDAIGSGKPSLNENGGRL